MIRVIFVGAVGRSGTTLLERALATSPHAVALGEVVHLWERSLGSDEPCGCGAPFSVCPYWSAVGDHAFGGWHQLDVDRVARDRRMVDRNRWIPLLIAPRLAPKRFRDAHRRTVSTLHDLYEGAAMVAAKDGNAPVLVDSSKHPSYLFLLRAVPELDVRLLHVVRDPRGVAHSWSKRVVRPESGAPMERLGTLRSCGRWTSHNLLFQLATMLRVPSVRLPYRAFTSEPLSLADAADHLFADNVPWRDELSIVGQTVALGTDHTVSGNPMRFTSGSVVVRSDEASREAMPAWSRWIVGLLTTPLRQLWKA